MCQSFFATFECELLDRRRFASQAEARMACFGFIEGWYNPVRLHSALGYRSPMAFEAAKATSIIDEPAVFYSPRARRQRQEQRSRSDRAHRCDLSAHARRRG
jgi:putative transposase